MRFSKYHGCQNDFILVESSIDSHLAKLLCHRHKGIGADGVAVISFDGPLPRMRIFNPDGSQPEMCGNALRCVVQHLRPRLGQQPWHIQTDAGVLTAWAENEDIIVDMGPAREPVRQLQIDVLNRTFTGHTTSMGNPHFVIETSSPQTDAECFGRSLSVHPTFSEGCNISFVRWVDPTHAEAFIYERGAGLTMACGTGACAVAHVGRTLGHLQSSGEAFVQLPGGTLGIGVSDEHLLMRGPAVWVFDGDTENHGLNSPR